MSHATMKRLRAEPPQAGGYIAANRWKGERGCLVGPFRAKSQAQVFEHYVLHHNGVRTPAGALREREDGWYISVPS